MLKFKFVLAVLITILGVPTFAEVYKWVDEHGNIQYSDKKPDSEQAEKVEIEPINVLPSLPKVFPSSPSDTVPEPWIFEFDFRPWQLGSHGADNEKATRNYFLSGQSEFDWTETVASVYYKSSLNVQDIFQQLIKEDPKCPSKKVTLIEEGPDTIIYEQEMRSCYGAAGLQGHISRTSKVKSGILTLSYTVNGQITESKRKFWLSTLKNAQIKQAYIVPERWDFEFDSRPWQLGFQHANDHRTTRTYFLAGQLLDNWTELIYSHHQETIATAREVFNQEKSKLEACLPTNVTLIEESSNTIIYKADKVACGVSQIEAFIQRISTNKSGIHTLGFEQREELSDENYNNWLSILRNARIKQVVRKETEVDDGPSEIFPSTSADVVPERLEFEFDSRPWKIGNQGADPLQVIRKYILPGQSVDDWTELVTSHYIKGRSTFSLKEYFEEKIKDPQYPSLKLSLIKEEPDKIIYEGSHGGCFSVREAAYIALITRKEWGMLMLTFCQKGQLSRENRNNWLEILRNARIK